VKTEYKHAGITYRLVSVKKARKSKNWRANTKSNLITDNDPRLVTWYSKAAIAEDDSGVVGVWGFQRRGGVIRSEYTEVSKAHARQGIAKRLWSLVLRVHQPHTVYATTISSRGLSLVNAVRERFPGIKFVINRPRRVSDLRCNDRIK